MTAAGLLAASAVRPMVFGQVSHSVFVHFLSGELIPLWMGGLLIMLAVWLLSKQRLLVAATGFVSVVVWFAISLPNGAGCDLLRFSEFPTCVWYSHTPGLSGEFYTQTSRPQNIPLRVGVVITGMVIVAALFLLVRRTADRATRPNPTMSLNASLACFGLVGLSFFVINYWMHASDAQMNRSGVFAIGHALPIEYVALTAIILAILISVLAARSGRRLRSLPGALVLDVAALSAMLALLGAAWSNSSVRVR